ncbi:MAG: 50S ribosomal protein L13 [Candidatus Nezhaarchaeota archaeon]|nr:50S ribosomal protein L13 [Candidatus Nezhaarchaeota archaeon]MCX8141787.1 50S ribosomal protein L13 [Candidatus Nezhaarchaeota archaeon]MDW8050434.1 50S ribosomal protein L13 [Nitrososphaerota archaeon]
MSQQVIVVDAEGQILGRMASLVAKRLLMGERVVIVNAEKAVISGNRRSIIHAYKEEVLSKKTWKRPEKGPKKYRRPDMIVKRVIRGMLPYKQWKGKKAYRNLRVYIGVPEEYAEVHKVKFPQAAASRLMRSYITVGELAKEVGWRP